MWTQGPEEVRPFEVPVEAGFDIELGKRLARAHQIADRFATREPDLTDGRERKAYIVRCRRNSLRARKKRGF